MTDVAYAERLRFGLAQVALFLAKRRALLCHWHDPTVDGGPTGSGHYALMRAQAAKLAAKG